MSYPDPVRLTQELVAIDTINPPGHELACIEMLAGILSDAGLKTEIHGFGESRANLVATLGEGPALCFTGHVDTVPLGNAPWRRDPFGGEIIDGRLYGRGSTDMKSGVAAFVSAACAAARKNRRSSGSITLIITAGEETGCDGAKVLVKAGALKKGDALVVAEPTSNMPMVGHKGALWLRAVTTGVTAHGSMPHLGVNAAYKAARVLHKLEAFEFNEAPHPHLGKPTLSVGAVRAGINVNSVPDRAEIDIDIRTIPSLAHVRVKEHLVVELGEDVTMSPLVDVPAVWTEPKNAWLADVFAAVHAVTGKEPLPIATVPYFTDASVLKPALGEPPTVVLGPGEPGMAHQTDEYCLVDSIRDAEKIYARLIEGWQG
ncbi:M20 family metallopeptidase [Afipia felis]|uniref:Probable succinyl-diaminopimelate desuccinylase n=2 Tax=Afipia felis TaxID=1035 RepID=A0A380WE58_AFIFE|nr:M20 family metallopeptidase [Afipia felis]EKS29663.1 ArgE/DapE family peptidase [Afipia felis ATCC 53690]SUU78370.1 Probable succinyl-diaminopimelate desuccinylase [Afipia felis]SUU86435.1 Probable succinyl-diaminopimelate desuccinylase [Afipia felis]